MHHSRISLPARRKSKAEKWPSCAAELWWRLGVSLMFIKGIWEWSGMYGNKCIYMCISIMCTYTYIHIHIYIYQMGNEPFWEIDWDILGHIFHHFLASQASWKTMSRPMQGSCKRCHTILGTVVSTHPQTMFDTTSQSVSQSVSQSHPQCYWPYILKYPRHSWSSLLFVWISEIYPQDNRQKTHTHMYIHIYIYIYSL